ncbi:PepSY domain-containing protein [Colwellia sp. Bg11-28]|uniref:PepSY domain-containing protein n=1 Tax=Colwellia sp. Bg11-28 TaxID=2058305 RepID=UPI000C32FA4F|nr:PepSY domain-containing protein [Colwellia sp. Bg11-28]PKH86345.1 hypothetical protein CXF79_16675 [Colwellia sp. Bg11-28]
MKKRNTLKQSPIKLSTIKKLHKWLSLLVFIQLFIWLSTGLFFNLMDHDKARGNQNKRTIALQKIEHKRLVNLDLIMNKNSKAVTEVALIQRLGKPYYLLTHEEGLYNHFKSDYSLVDAYVGDELIIDDDVAGKLAQASYKGKGDINSVVKLEPPITDMLKEQNSVWQVNFSDDLETSVYLDASSGRLVGHSNEDKRFVDFFFMLHFMDYPFLGEGSVGGFNNGQITFFALLTLVFCLTGFIWVIELLRKGRYKFS